MDLNIVSIFIEYTSKNLKKFINSNETVFK